MPFPLDLFVLAADADQKAAIDVLLESRCSSLGIPKCRFEVRRHPQRDPGCARHGVELLSLVKTQAQHALIVLDWEGSGRESIGAEDLEREIDDNLDQAGWEGRARAVVIDPESEIWLWSDSPHVAETFGWKKENGDLQTWLVQNGWLGTGRAKPGRPKEAMLAVFRETGVRPSAANFAAIAGKVSLERCQDRSFLRLRSFLRRWFRMPESP